MKGERVITVILRPDLSHRNNQLEASTLSDPAPQVGSKAHLAINLTLSCSQPLHTVHAPHSTHTEMSDPYTLLPHQPNFDGIIGPATLYAHVSSVKGNIVKNLVFLEEVGGLKSKHVAQDFVMTSEER